jgi:hypothetical protein
MGRLTDWLFKDEIDEMSEVLDLGSIAARLRASEDAMRKRSQLRLEEFKMADYERLKLLEQTLKDPVSVNAKSGSCHHPVDKPVDTPEIYPPRGSIAARLRASEDAMRKRSQLKANLDKVCVKDNSLPGAKADQGKPRPGLVMKGFCNALWEVTKLGTFGAIKYSEFGFLKVENGIARYEDAGLRHQFTKWMSDDDYAIDPETNLMEATAKAWNALAELELLLRKRKG